jgi:hypothetical protein
MLMRLLTSLSKGRNSRNKTKHQLMSAQLMSSVSVVPTPRSKEKSAFSSKASAGSSSSSDRSELLVFCKHDRLSEGSREDCHNG